MKLTPYKKMLKFAKDKKDELLAPIRANQAKKQAELEMSKLDEKIATAQTDIQEISSEHPIDFNKLIKSLDELALIERRRKQFEKIIKELFDTEDEE